MSKFFRKMTIAWLLVAVALTAHTTARAALVPDPTDPNLRLWLDASTLAGPDGTVITTWADGGFHGNNATGSNGTLQTVTINGAPGNKVVRFNGTSTNYDAGGLGSFSDGWTMLFVGKQSATGNQKWVGYHELGSDPAANVSWLGSGNAGQPAGYDFGVTGTHSRSNIATTGSDFNLYTIHYDTSTAVLSRDGDEKSSFSASGVSYTDMHFVLGRRSWATSGYYNGDVAEMIVYNGALSASEQTTVEFYLAGKYNLSHPLQTIGDDLVGYWRFEGSADDFTSYDNDGVLKNGAGFAAGKFGQALSLDGVNQYVEVPNDISLNPGTDSFTIAGWINVTDGEGDHALLGKPATGGGFGLRVLDGTVNSLRGGMQHDVGGYQSTFDSRGEDDLKDGEWHHIAMVVDRSVGRQELFVDGASLGWRDITSFTGDMTSADPLTIGQFLSGSFAKGLIDDTALWTRALSDKEIALLGANGGIELLYFVIPEPGTGLLAMFGGLLLVLPLRPRKRLAAAARGE